MGSVKCNKNSYYIFIENKKLCCCFVLLFFFLASGYCLKTKYMNRLINKKNLSFLSQQMHSMHIAFIEPRAFTFVHLIIFKLT